VKLWQEMALRRHAQERHERLRQDLAGWFCRAVREMEAVQTSLDRGELREALGTAEADDLHDVLEDAINGLLGKGPQFTPGFLRPSIPPIPLERKEGGAA
jgi:hypothetical protein